MAYRNRLHLVYTPVREMLTRQTGAGRRTVFQTGSASDEENAKKLFGQFRTIGLRNSARIVQTAYFDRERLTR